MDFSLCKIDPYTATTSEIEAEIERLAHIQDEFKNKEQAIKRFINSIYGALANQFCVGSNVYIAEAVTLQGQNLAKFASKCIDKYFKDVWHKDYATHKKLGVSNVSPIMRDTLTIYQDTDSISKDSMVDVKMNGEHISLSIEDWYNYNLKNGSAGETLAGHASVPTKDKILNWDKSLYYANVKRIIRHKVKKPKWLLKTKGGKSVEITNDHSLVVFRDNNKIKIKPSEVKQGDKVLTIL